MGKLLMSIVIPPVAGVALYGVVTGINLLIDKYPEGMGVIGIIGAWVLLSLVVYIESD